MDGSTRFKEPIACTEGERREFEQMVRLGFRGSDETLNRRILEASLLAFHYRSGDTLSAIAALKAPGERYREDVFEKADAPTGDPGDYELELGWVFVLPEHRRNRIASDLCQRLLAQAPAPSVFATTRVDNTAMMRILDDLGFERAGKPYPRRDEKLVLYLRP